MTTQTTSDLTHAEARDAFTAFARTISLKCDVYVTLETGSGPALRAAIYPDGIGRNARLEVRGDTWRELLAGCEAKWMEHADLHGANVTREMALAIISITADLGECTDAALRAKFDAADIARYGERACEQATSMASNGPFSIVKLSGANDAEAA